MHDDYVLRAVCISAFIMKFILKFISNVYTTYVLLRILYVRKHNFKQH